MSQYIDTPTKKFVASAAIAAHLRVKLNGSNKLAVCGAGATENELGTITEEAFADGDIRSVRLTNAMGTTKMVALTSFSREVLLYAGAGGYVDDVVNGKPIGIALEAATALYDVVEVLRVNATVIVTTATALDDIDITWGDSSDVVARFSTGDASDPAFVLGLDDSSQQMHITDKAAVATDWIRTAGTHPELAIHSNTTPVTDYLAIGNHDGTTASIDVVGGTTLDFDIAGTTALAVLAATVTATGRFVSTAMVGNTAGIGITGTATSWVTSVQEFGTLTKTTMIIDLTSLNSGAGADDIIGADGAGKAHLGRITTAVNGAIIVGKLTCLETPATADDDIDVYSATEDTGVEDTAIGDLTETQLCNSGDLTVGVEVALTAPAADQYIYLVGGTGGDATYSAGILMLEFWGE